MRAMGDRRGKGVLHIESEDNGFHTPHESDSDFVSKPIAHELGSDSVSEATYSSEEETDGERDSMCSDDKRPRHRHGELWSIDCGRQHTSNVAPSVRGASFALHGDLQVSVCLAVHKEDGGREEHRPRLQVPTIAAAMWREVHA